MNLNNLTGENTPAVNISPPCAIIYQNKLLQLVPILKISLRAQFSYIGELFAMRPI